MRASRCSRLLVGLVVLAASCGGGSGGALGSIADVQVALAEGGVDCPGEPGPYVAHPDEISIGVDPVEALECTTAGGAELSVTRFASTSDLQRAWKLASGMVCDWSTVPVLVVRAGAVMVSPVDAAVTKEVVAELDKVGDALGASVEDMCGGEIDPGQLADASGELGEPIQLGDATTITLSHPRVGDDDGLIEVDVEVVNASSTSAQAPGIDVVCAGGGDDDSGWNVRSTYPTYEDVKPGESASGVMVLIPPGHDDAVECAGPAVLRVQGDGPEVPLPDDVIDAYNAALASADG